MPFLARQEEGRLRLLTLLQHCMIRASKAELINLGIPPLHFKVRRSTCSTCMQGEGTGGLQAGR